MSSTNMNKKHSIALIVVALVALGAYFFPRSVYQTIVQQVPGQSLGAASPVGSNFSNAKFAGVTISLVTPGANGTSTSILNTDVYDRYVTATKIGCQVVGTSQTAYTGAGLSSLQFSVGTTSTSAPGTHISWANVMKNFAVSTSTVDLLVSSSTLATATSTLASVWPTGSYMTFSTNATNTAQCTVGVDYFGS